MTTDPPDLIWLPSPTVLPALHVKGKILLAVALDYLMQGRNFDGKTPEIYQRMVIAEFYRMTVQDIKTGDPRAGAGQDDRWESLVQFQHSPYPRNPLLERVLSF